MSEALFREEAVDAQRNGTLGSITLATPISRYYVAAAALAIAIAIVSILVFASYTRRERIVGVLVRDPIDQKLIAQFLVPTRAAGFLAKGAPLLLRYHAYPYQKFGLQRGTVASIPDAPIDFQTAAALGIPPGAGPVLRVDATIAEQQISVYGRRVPLRPGMTLEADVMLDRRRLIEWIFEPLYGMRQLRSASLP